MPSGQGHDLDSKELKAMTWNLILKNKMSSGQGHGLDLILTPSTWSLFDINYENSVPVPIARSNESPSIVSSSSVKVATFLEKRIIRN